jgi:hypothetical protein
MMYGQRKMRMKMKRACAHFISRRPSARGALTGLPNFSGKSQLDFPTNDGHAERQDHACRK